MIYLCDFEDSFTYNIYADLLTITKNIEIIKFKNVFKFLQTKINSSEKEVIILGPGPGHPKDYEFLNQSITKLLFRENLMLVGVCLGHQIIWQSQGYECQHSAIPIHGQALTINFDDEWLKRLNLKVNDITQVQRYNSLSIKMNQVQQHELIDKNGWSLNSINNELMCSYKPGVITYQFHPESVGTSCPHAYYRPIEQFLL